MLQLLRNVSGAFRPKVLTALVGVSGAGKTTLMDVLAGRKTGTIPSHHIARSSLPFLLPLYLCVNGVTRAFYGHVCNISQLYLLCIKYVLGREYLHKK